MQGRIPAIQYGNRGAYRLRRADVLAYIEASRLAAPEHRGGDAAGARPKPGAE